MRRLILVVAAVATVALPTSIAVVMANIITDLLYAVADPRIRMTPARA